MSPHIIKRPPGRDEFFRAFESLSDTDKEMIGCAYQFSKIGHSHETRASGERYFDHPKAVAWILVMELNIIDWQSIVDALLHDIRENTFLLTHFRIVLNFGMECGKDVDAMTHREGEILADYSERIFLRGARAILVKLCDRLHNMRTLNGKPCERWSSYTEETRQFYIPMASRLVHRLPQNEVWKAQYLKGQLEIECAKFV